MTDDKRPALDTLRGILADANQLDALRAIERVGLTLSDILTDPDEAANAADAISQATGTAVDTADAVQIVRAAYSDRSYSPDADAGMIADGYTDDALSIDFPKTARIALTLGGPNVFVDLNLDDEYRPYSGRIVYTWGSDQDTALLTADEIARVLYRYGIDSDSLAEYAGMAR